MRQMGLTSQTEKQPAGIRKALIDTEVYLKYEKSIRNLNIQEARLNRMYDKDRAELQRVQTTRKRDERIAALAAEAAAKARQATAAGKNGFDFSNPAAQSNPCPARAANASGQPSATLMKAAAPSNL